MKNYFLLILTSLILASCGTKFSLQKRRYTKGFYFAGHHTKKVNPHSQEQNQTARLDYKQVQSPVFERVAENEVKEHETLATTKVSEIGITTKSILLHPLAVSENAQNLVKLNNTYRQQELKSEVKSAKHQKGILAKVARFILAFVAGILLVFGIIAYAAATVSGNAAAMLVAYALFAGAVLCLVLAIVIKVT